eukprot:scaffold17773_cov47-Phaeocystis_antarctica.AAC.1
MIRAVARARPGPGPSSSPVPNPNTTPYPNPNPNPYPNQVLAAAAALGCTRLYGSDLREDFARQVTPNPSPSPNPNPSPSPSPNLNPSPNSTPTPTPNQAESNLAATGLLRGGSVRHTGLEPRSSRQGPSQGDVQGGGEGLHVFAHDATRPLPSGEALGLGSGRKP